MRNLALLSTIKKVNIQVNFSGANLILHLIWNCDSKWATVSFFLGVVLGQVTSTF
jgi:hypothetical protein